MMTDAELDAIKARCDAATPGKWYVRHCDDEKCMNMTVISSKDYGDRHSGNFDCEDDTIAITFHQCYPFVACNETADITTWKLGKYDSEFIANSRTDVPALSAEVKRLRALNVQMLEALKSARDTHIKLCNAVDGCYSQLCPDVSCEYCFLSITEDLVDAAIAAAEGEGNENNNY